MSATSNHLSTKFYVKGDKQIFLEGIQTAISQVEENGIFTGDQISTFGRNLSFLKDRDFMAAFRANARNDTEESLIWRNYIVCWAAKRALLLKGDFVECGCYAGTTARIVADYVGIGDTDKRFYLYDLFEIPPDMRRNHAMAKHGQNLHAEVQDRFADNPNVRIVKGYLPETLEVESPEQISFLHMDISDPKAEGATLARLFDRVSPGGAIILNCYGWLGFPQHKSGADRFLEGRNSMALELPTGQGLIIK